MVRLSESTLVKWCQGRLESFPAHIDVKCSGIAVIVLSELLAEAAESICAVGGM